MENDIPPVQQTPPPVPPHTVIQPVGQTIVRPKRGGRGWMIFSLVLLAIVAAMIFSRLGGSSTGAQSGFKFQEVLVENNKSLNKVAIIDISGIITRLGVSSSGRNMVELISDQLDAAERDDSVKAVVLKIDSPGGEVLASDDISRALEDFQKEAKKPIVAAMGGLAASGGYYVAAPCRWIVANELTITGSIGVIMSSFNYRSLMDKVGLAPVVFKSGRFKDMLRGSKAQSEIDPAEMQMVQDMVDQTFKKFKQVVRDGRGRVNESDPGSKKLASDWETYADGRILTGTQAFELGFVDQLGNFDTAVDKALTLASISDANLIRYQEPFSFGDMFRLFGAPKQPPVVKIEVGPEMLRLEAGRMYFLSPMVLQ